FEDMEARLADAHLFIGRAGASTIAELTAVGRPAILVPLPIATDDHQAATAAHAAWNCGRPNAARDLADLVESFGGAEIQDVIRVGREAPKAVAARATAAHREIEDTLFGPLARHLEGDAR